MTTPEGALRAALRFANRDLPASAERVDGTTLALYRTAAGVTAAEVARALDASKQYVSNLETGGAIISTAGRYRAAVDLVAAERAATSDRLDARVLRRVRPGLCLARRGDIHGTQACALLPGHADDHQWVTI